MSTNGFKITVIGIVNASFGLLPDKRLSPASRQLLAVLVAAGPTGLAVEEIARERDPVTPPAQQAIRMAIARLRRHFPKDTFPRADNGKYCINLSSDEVDAWRLEALAAAPDPDLDDPHLSHLLRIACPYVGAGQSELLDQSARRIERLQREILIRVAESHPDLIRGELLDALQSHSADDVANEALLAAAVQHLARHGRRAEALRSLRAGRRAFVDAGLTLNAQLLEIERELLDGTNGLPTPVPREHPLPLPNQLAAQRSGSYVGHRIELRRVTAAIDGASAGVATLLLSGLSGSGKSRLSAEAAAHAADAGWAVALLAPSLQDGQAPLGPLIALDPSLGTKITELFQRSADADSARVGMWEAAHRSLETIRRQRPLLLVIDDAQWLDDATSDFIGHLATAGTIDRTMIVLNGRNDVRQSARWKALRTHLESLTPLMIEVGALDVDGIRSLVDDLRPNMNGALLAASASEIFERSAGLPGIAIPLLAAMPPGSAVLPRSRSLRQRLPLADAIESLPAEVLEVGIAAAVVGPRFIFNDLLTVVRLPPAGVLDAIDTLIDRDLLIDHSLIEFELAHVLVERSLLGASTRTNLMGYHRLAAEVFGSDVHRRARHLFAALPQSSTTEAVEALRASARLRLSEGAYRECIRQFDAARSLNPASLTAVEFGSLARALDLTGMHDEATERRQAGFDLAAEAHEWVDALNIAASGLPEAEPLDGDPAIAANLRRVDTSSLPTAEVCRHATISARQLAIVGQEDEGLRFAETAVRLAETPTERVSAALNHRLAMSGATKPAACLDALRSVSDQLEHVDDALLGDYLLSLALDLYRMGNIEESASVLCQLEQTVGRSIVKVWQSGLMRAMHHSDAGSLGEAQIVRAAAHRTATHAGLGEADNALLAATFVEVWITGGAGIFAGEVDGGALDPSHRLLTKAGASAALWAANERERAMDLARESVAEAFAGARPQRLTVLAVVTEQIAATDDTALIALVRSAFEDAGSSMVVLGAGAANLGPASRYRAMLAVDGNEQKELLVDALTLADRSGSLMWRVAIRRDLVAAGFDEHRAELRTLGAGTELAGFAGSS